MKLKKLSWLMLGTSLLASLVSWNGQVKAFTQPVQNDDFWNHFKRSVLAISMEETNTTAVSGILDNGAMLIKSHLTNEFACQAAYRLAVKYYQAGIYTNALKVADLALELTETQPGNHLLAWNLKAECYKSMGNYSSAIQASEEVLNREGPALLREDIHELALIRKADMILLSTNVTNAEREVAEAIL